MNEYWMNILKIMNEWMNEWMLFGLFNQSFNLSLFFF